MRRGGGLRGGVGPEPAAWRTRHRRRLPPRQRFTALARTAGRVPRVLHLADMSIAGCGLFCLASIALMSAVPKAVVAGTSEPHCDAVRDRWQGHTLRPSLQSGRIVAGHRRADRQDDQGFMWFGTPAGLDRFDGYTFDQYKRGAGGSRDLSGVVVTALLKDRSGAPPGLVSTNSSTGSTRPPVPLHAIAPTQTLRAAREDASSASLRIAGATCGLGRATVWPGWTRARDNSPTIATIPETREV